MLSSVPHQLSILRSIRTVDRGARQGTRKSKRSNEGDEGEGCTRQGTRKSRRLNEGDADEIPLLNSNGNAVVGIGQVAGNLAKISSRFRRLAASAMSGWSATEKTCFAVTSIIPMFSMSSVKARFRAKVTKMQRLAGVGLKSVRHTFIRTHFHSHWCAGNT